MIVLNIWGYFGRNKQNSYAALNNLNFYLPDVLSRYRDLQFKQVKLTYICLIWGQTFANNNV